MNTQRSQTAKRTAALLRAGLAVVLFALVTSAGCSWFQSPAPRQPETVGEFMRQPRPGGGILGN